MLVTKVVKAKIMEFIKKEKKFETRFVRNKTPPSKMTALMAVTQTRKNGGGGGEGGVVITNF